MRHAIALPVALALFVGGCSSNKSPEQPTLHEVMKDEIDANADKIWDLTNPALGDQAEIVPSKMNDTQWAQLRDYANKVQAGAQTLATMNAIVVAKPGVKIADEGVVNGSSAADVQAEIDKDPAKLRELAGALAQHMAELANAAGTEDAAKAGPLIDQLDGVCEDCHLQFWYPSQRELVQKFRNENNAPPLK